MVRDYGFITARERREEVLKYVRKNPKCEMEDIIKALTEGQVGSRVTIRSAVRELLESGKLNDGKIKRNSKSYQFTVVEDNPLLTMPTDLELITSKFEKFLSIIRKLKSETRKIHYKINYKKDNPLLYQRIELGEIVDTIPYLPYYVISVIDEIYKFNLLVKLPAKIHRQSVLNDLYSLYFEYLTKLYRMASEETQTVNSSGTNLSIEETSLFKAYRESKVTFTYYPVWISRVANIESDLYDVLDEVWLRNIDVCPYLYELQTDSKLLLFQDGVKKTAKYNDLGNNNKILKKIHLKMDCEILTYEDYLMSDPGEREDPDLPNYFDD